MKVQGPIYPKPTTLVNIKTPKLPDTISNLIQREYHKYCITEKDVDV